LCLYLATGAPGGDAPPRARPRIPRA
jgi:hypothetical protein